MITGASATTSEAARDEFLQLLVTQLRHQDPLEPVNQQDFLGQLAQFSTLEGVEKLNANFEDMLKLQELTQGANLIGRQVAYHPQDAAVPVLGIVDAVSVENGKMVLSVNGQSLTLDDVVAFTA